MLRPAKAGNASNCQSVAANSFDLSTHSNEHSAQLLQVGLARSVVNRRNPWGKYGSHDNIGSSSNRGFVEQNVRAFETLCGSFYPIEVCALFIDELGPKLHESFKVRIQPASANLVSSGLGDVALSEASEHRAHYHHGSAQRCTLLFIGFAKQEVYIN